MAGSVIGIKIADGSFFPVLERSHTGKKKLVLTTVNDEQESVQIDLYQGENGSMEGAEYIGSLVVSNIQPAAKGDPEISLVLGIDAEGNLTATATDAATGEYESLSVSLESFEEEPYMLPDFQLDEAEQLNDFSVDEDFGEPFEELEEGSAEPAAEEAFSAGASTEASTAPTGPRGAPEDAEEAPIAYSRPAEEARPRRRGHLLLFAGFMILSLAALAFLVYFIFRMLRGPELPPLEARVPVTYLALSPLIVSYIPEGARGHRTRSPR
ncbi:MAG: Hsp70 family protein [Spirochaetaceae bacterium]